MHLAWDWLLGSINQVGSHKPTLSYLQATVVKVKLKLQITAWKDNPRKNSKYVHFYVQIRKREHWTKRDDSTEEKQVWAIRHWTQWFFIPIAIEHTLQPEAECISYRKKKVNMHRKSYSHKLPLFYFTKNQSTGNLLLHLLKAKTLKLILLCVS